MGYYLWPKITYSQIVGHMYAYDQCHRNSVTGASYRSGQKRFPGRDSLRAVVGPTYEARRTFFMGQCKDRESVWWVQ